MHVYLDNSSTTMPYPSVIEAMNEALQTTYANPSSLHGMGAKAQQLVEGARRIIARSLGASRREIFFTSGGTESVNASIFGAWRGRRKHQNKIITSSVEHPAVLNACRWLEGRGAEVVYLPVTREGSICLDTFEQSLSEDTLLVSFMHSNNETGTLMPIAEAAECIARSKVSALLHVDFVQSYGKVDVDVRDMDIDLLSISAHKVHGPKGVGALYVRDPAGMTPLLFGGGQEGGLRSGTENVPGIAGFAQAVAEQQRDEQQRRQYLFDVRNYLRHRIEESIEGVVYHTPPHSVPSILSAGFTGCLGEVLLRMLEQEQIYVSTGAACSSKQPDSHVLTAMGLDRESIEGTVRFSVSEFNTKSQMDHTVRVLASAVESQRALRGYVKRG